uniref:Uncharacterized protein n=1 Tax=Amphimedon queenslandica TaxID=400682 RepID=A0A1X7T5C6_AMPQE
EHRNLQPDMLTDVGQNTGNSRPCLQYDENGSKNNPGGLKEQKVTKKGQNIC